MPADGLGVVRTRRYWVNTPPGFNSLEGRIPSNKGWPLLICFHGAGGGNGLLFNSVITLSTLNQQCNARGFVVVYPEAWLGEADPYQVWNDGRGLVDLFESHALNIDDVAFFKAVRDAVCLEYHCDRRRVFVSGFSNGAMMVHRLIQEASDEIQAAAVVCSGLSSHHKALKPKRPISMILSQGTADPLMPNGGGDLIIGEPPENHGNVLSANNSALYYVQHLAARFNHNFLITNTVAEGVLSNRDVYYGPKGTAIHQYKNVGGGHAWPGGGQYYAEEVIGKVPLDYSMSEFMLNFFREHETDNQ